MQFCLLHSQGIQPRINLNEKSLVVDSVSVILKSKYVFPDVAEKMGDLVKSNFHKRIYDKLEDPQEFAQVLTEDLRSIGKDKHLRVMYAPDFIKMSKQKKDSANTELDEFQGRMDRFNNYGFKEIKILPGNIGYLKFNEFNPAQEAFSVAIGAMGFLANADALIIDLRNNGGGSPEMIQLISSYFFEGEPKHLNSFYHREKDQVDQFWTLPFVPGRKLANIDIYVLTSNRTFSGAEEFSYNLKNMKRAIIVGETTGGGAHPVDMVVIDDNFAMNVPYARAINPITKTNWEGTGVEPDVKVSQDKALETAQMVALKKMAGKEKNEKLKDRYVWAYEGFSAMVKPIQINKSVLKSYAGSYGPRKIIFKDEYLYYQRENGASMKMIPISEDYFMFDEIDYFRVKFQKLGNQVTGIEGHYDNGTIDSNPKTE